MKPQDIGFFLIVIVLFFIKKPRVFLLTGLLCWVLAIPLFSKWVFFTAERFTWYGAAFILTFLLTYHEK